MLRALDRSGPMRREWLFAREKVVFWPCGRAGREPFGHTRRLILMGSYLEHATGTDPDKRDRLMKGLDVFLEREQYRELFGLAPNKEISDGNPD